MCGTKYYILTFEELGKHLSGFVIIARDGSTTVTITLPNLGSSVHIDYGGKVYHSDNQLQTVLEENEMFQVCIKL